MKAENNLQINLHFNIKQLDEALNLLNSDFANILLYWPTSQGQKLKPNL